MIGSLDNAQTWAPWILAFMGAGATYIWRALGTAIAAKIDPDSDLFTWIACVAYGLFASLIARIMLFPVGVLAETTTTDRLAAAAAGFVIFFLTKRNIFASTFCAAGVFGIIVWGRADGLF